MKWEEKLGIYLPDHIQKRYILRKILSISSSRKVVLCKDKITFDTKILKIIKKTDSQKKELNILTHIPEFNGIIRPEYVFDMSTMEILIFPFYEKGDLFDNGFNLTENELKVITKQMIDILCHLKNQHIIHLDIKPENLLLSDCGKIVLIDFGLAQNIIDGGIYATDYVGTFPYIAPEVYYQYFYTYKADLWSLGITLLTCILKMRVFQKEEYENYCMNGGLSSCIEQLKNSNMSNECKDFILSLLQFDPNKRPSAENLIMHPWINDVVNPYDIMEVIVKTKGCCGFFSKK